MRFTRRVAEFVRDLKYEALPAEVVAKAKVCVLDLLGGALAAVGTPSSEIARRLALEGFGEGSVTVIGEKRGSTAAGAAWANCQTACALDVDDGHNWAVGHPGSVVIPAALAVAESRGAPGRALIEAVVAGYETSVRIAGSRVPAYIHTYASGPWGVYGAALAAAKLLGLDAERLVHTIGIAGSHGPARPHSKDYEFVPRLKECIGWAGTTGVSAALLAELGFTGFVDLLDYGEFFDGGLMTKTLGTGYEIMGVWFKPHTSCRWTHSSIDATLRLKELHGISKDDVTGVRILAFERASIMGSKTPRSSETAQYSIPWCVASALVDGEVGPAQVAEGRLGDPELLELAAKVEIVYDDELQRLFPSKFPAVVEIRTRGGTYRARVDSPKGDGDDPMTWDEIETKFLKLATPVIGEARAGEVRERVLNIEDERGLSAVMSLLKRSEEVPR